MNKQERMDENIRAVHRQLEAALAAGDPKAKAFAAIGGGSELNAARKSLGLPPLPPTKTDEFGGVLDDLRKAATTELGNYMSPFGEEGITCPWMHWRKKYGGGAVDIQGIFIMQDWWNASIGGLGSDLVYLNNPAAFKYNQDKTNYTLYNNTKWRDAIWNNKTWLVTNAVWGLRKGSKTSGDLGAKIHKAAFGIWSQLVAKFATSKDFKVVFAGGWSSDESERRDRTPLADFLDAWGKWATTNSGKISANKLPGFSRVQGQAYFCPHPSVWPRTKGWECNFNYKGGPP